MKSLIKKRDEGQVKEGEENKENRVSNGGGRKESVKYSRK